MSGRASGYVGHGAGRSPAGGVPWAPVAEPGEEVVEVTRYLISFDASAMDHISQEDVPSVAAAAHAVIREALRAGVYVFSGGLEEQMPGIVDSDGAVTEGSYPEAIGGANIVEVPSYDEALEWARKIAVACRCSQEVRAFMADPELDILLGPGKSPGVGPGHACPGRASKPPAYSAALAAPSDDFTVSCADPVTDSETRSPLAMP